MPVRYVSGDLFANEHDAEALAHGCNCQGSMGAGIAVGFRQRYPAMFEEYRRRCLARPREFNPGNVFLWKEPGRPAVFDLATQEHYRGRRATYEAVEETLLRMRAMADAEGISRIAIPKVGAGRGGLEWDRVREIIERAFGEWSGTLFVYEEYHPDG